MLSESTRIRQKTAWRPKGWDLPVGPSCYLPFRFFRSAAFLLLTFAAAFDAFVAISLVLQYPVSRCEKADWELQYGAL